MDVDPQTQISSGRWSIWLCSAGFHRSGSAFNPSCWNYPRAGLLFRDAPRARPRCGSPRSLETRIRIEHRARNSESQKRKVEASGRIKSGPTAPGLGPALDLGGPKSLRFPIHYLQSAAGDGVVGIFCMCGSEFLTSSRRDRIDANALLRELERDSLGQSFHSMLRCHVNAHLRQPNMSGDARCVNNGPSPALLKATSRRP